MNFSTQHTWASSASRPSNLTIMCSPSRGRSTSSTLQPLGLRSNRRTRKLMLPRRRSVTSAVTSIRSAERGVCSAARSDRNTSPALPPELQRTSASIAPRPGTERVTGCPAASGSMVAIPQPSYDRSSRDASAVVPSSSARKPSIATGRRSRRSGSCTALAAARRWAGAFIASSRGRRARGTAAFPPARLVQVYATAAFAPLPARAVTVIPLGKRRFNATGQRAALPQPVQDFLEHGRMDRAREVDPGVNAFDPTDLGLDRSDPLELDPHQLLELRALDELDPAAVERGVGHPHLVVELSGPAQRDLRVERNAFAPARR